MQFRAGDLVNSWMTTRQQSALLAKDGETWTLSRMAIGFREHIRFSKDMGPIHVYFRPINPRIDANNWVYLVGYLPTSKVAREMDLKPIGVARYDPKTESFILTITNAVNVNVWILNLVRVEKAPYVQFIQNAIPRVKQMTPEQYSLVKTIFHETIAWVGLRRLHSLNQEEWVYVFYDSEIPIFITYPAHQQQASILPLDIIYAPLDTPIRMQFLQECWDNIILPRLSFFDQTIDTDWKKIPIKRNLNIVL